MADDLESHVRHNLAHHRYELDADGGTAVAEYYERDGARIFTHTEVPRRSEGRGVGSKLVHAALADTKRAGFPPAHSSLRLWRAIPNTERRNAKRRRPREAADKPQRLTASLPALVKDSR